MSSYQTIWRRRVCDERLRLLRTVKPTGLTIFNATSIQLLRYHVTARLENINESQIAFEMATWKMVDEERFRLRLITKMRDFIADRLNPVDAIASHLGRIIVIAAAIGVPQLNEAEPLAAWCRRIKKRIDDWFDESAFLGASS